MFPLRFHGAPVRILFLLGGIGIFPPMKPKRKPVKVSLVDRAAVGGLPFDVIFIREDIEVYRMACVGERRMRLKREKQLSIRHLSEDRSGDPFGVQRERETRPL